MPENFVVQIGQFEGPIDLLLQLIQNKKLHISEVSMASVTDEYIEHMDKIPDLSPANTANFILVASTLMFIKSHSLLPTLTLTDEEEQSVDELEKRLILYKRIKELSIHVRDMYGKNAIYPREPRRDVTPIFSPSKEITKQNILTSIKELITGLPKIEIIPEVLVQKVMSLEDVIKNLAGRIEKALSMSFGDFISDKKEKMNVVVSFLGMLELVKQGVINVRQENAFKDINIEKRQ